jgi:hypothetical protein
LGSLIFILIDQEDQHRNNDADHDTGSERKIKSKVVFFDGNIPRQFTQKWYSASKMDNGAGNQNYRSCDDQKFSHIQKLI